MPLRGDLRQHPLAVSIAPSYRTRIVVGYSGTPLPQKLGIKPGAKLGLFDAPPGFDRTLGALREGVTQRTKLGGSLDVAVFFTISRAALEKRFAALAKAIAPAGSLWISWPKKSSGKKTDLDENVVRKVGLEGGL